MKNIFHKIKTNKNYQLGIMALVLVLGASFVWAGVYYTISQKDNQIVLLSNQNEIIENDNIEPATNNQARKLDGTIVDEKLTNLHPVAIMVENLASDQVRPQFGLSKAQIVYEVIVEAGITRFMAVYSTEEAMEKIGPVRSARPTFLEFVSEYDGMYVHAGGSPEALASIDGLGIKDCSALSGDSRFFWRDQDKSAPHNLLTSTEKLTYALRDKNLLNKQVEFDSWKFKYSSSLENDTPTKTNNNDNINTNVSENTNIDEQKVISINFSHPEYLVEWKYDKKNNDFMRYNGGQEHKDALTDKIITTKNVIIQMVPPAISAGEDGRVNFDVTGDGDVYIFNDGKMITGTWKKPDRVSRTLFYDANGDEIELNAGNIWIEILPTDQSFAQNF